MQKAKVVAFTALAAVAYGIVHDQITAHLCIEYFTVAHPPLFHTESPVLLGLCWGIAATIGIGIVLGALLAAAAQSGEAPPYPMPRLVRSIFKLLGAMALAACLAGALGFELSRHSIVSLPQSFAAMIRPERRDRFMAVWCAHCASYLAGLGGGGFLVFQIWRKRGKPHILAPVPATPASIIRTLLLVLAAIAIIYVRFIRQGR